MSFLLALDVLLDVPLRRPSRGELIGRAAVNATPGRGHRVPVWRTRSGYVHGVSVDGSSVVLVLSTTVIRSTGATPSSDDLSPRPAVAASATAL